MVDQRHDVICRLAVAEAARPGMAAERLTLTEASPVCVTARIERWSLPRAPDVPMRRRRLPMRRRADGSRASTLIRGTGTGGRAGALARSGRCVAAGLLLAFAALVALPSQAEAQTSITQTAGGATWTLTGYTLVEQGSTYTFTLTLASGNKPTNEYAGFYLPDTSVNQDKLGTDPNDCTSPEQFCISFSGGLLEGIWNGVQGHDTRQSLLSGTSPHTLTATFKVASDAPDGSTIEFGAIKQNGLPRDDGMIITVGDGGTVPTNAAPIFTDGTSTPRDFNETIGDATVTTASNIGAPVAATDTDTGDTLSYSFDGGTDDARFGIITTTGQIQTKIGENYSYEAKASYAVRVKVEDGNSGSDTIDVTLNVTDQDEAPLRPVAPTVKGHNQTTKLVVSMTAPQNTDRPPITGYKIRIHRPGYVWYEFEWVTTKPLMHMAPVRSTCCR